MFFIFYRSNYCVFDCLIESLFDYSVLRHAIVDQAANSCTGHSGTAVRDTIETTFDKFLNLPASRAAGLDRNILNLCSPPVLSSFDHLLHYGGTYYCYISCRALANHVWQRTLGKNMWDRDFGSRLQKFFHRGSSDQSLDAIIDLVGDGKSEKHVPLTAMVDTMQKSLSNIPSAHPTSKL